MCLGPDKTQTRFQVSILGLLSVPAASRCPVSAAGTGIAALQTGALLPPAHLPSPQVLRTQEAMLGLLARTQRALSMPRASFVLSNIPVHFLSGFNFSLFQYMR